MKLNRKHVVLAIYAALACLPAPWVEASGELERDHSLLSGKWDGKAMAAPALAVNVPPALDEGNEPGKIGRLGLKATDKLSEKAKAAGLEKNKYIDKIGLDAKTKKNLIDTIVDTTKKTTDKSFQYWMGLYKFNKLKVLLPVASHLLMAGGGALAGMAFGGPLGAVAGGIAGFVSPPVLAFVVGAVVGAISGLFKAGKSLLKKRK